jgi:hypothetical protein
MSCWRSYCAVGVPADAVGGTVVAFIPAVVGVSAGPFEHAVAGVPDVASFPADPGVPILAGDFVE